jgi:hypothetical protein
MGKGRRMQKTGVGAPLPFHLLCGLSDTYCTNFVIYQVSLLPSLDMIDIIA